MSSLATPKNVFVLVSAVEMAAGLVVVSLLWFAHPMADDFCRAAAVGQRGIIDGVTVEYLTTSGRWAGIGLVYLLSALGDLSRSYALVLGAVMAVSTLGWVKFIGSLVGPEISATAVWFVAASLLLMHWSGARPPGEPYYWLTGAIENQLSLGLAAGVLGVVICVSRRANTDQPLVLTIALIIGAFTVCAFHELYGLMLTLTLLVGGSLAWLWGYRNWSAWIVVGLGALAGLVVVMLAPGNFVRAARRAGHGDFELAFTVALPQAAKHLGRWLLDLRLWAAMVAMASPRLDAGGTTWEGLARLRFLLPAGIAVFLGLGFLVPTVALGAAAPGRTVNALYLIFLAGWGLTVMSWRSRILARMGADSVERRERMSLIGMAALAASIVLYGSLPRAVLDLTGDAWAYDATLENRYGMIRAQSERGIKDIEVPPVPSYPRSFVGAGWDITEDSRNWRNICVAEFFGLQSIRVAGVKK
jgi:hypothetical protein